MNLRSLATLVTFAVIAATSAPAMAMEGQLCKHRRHIRPIGNNANVPIRRIPKAKTPVSQAHLHKLQGRYPYKGGRKTPKGVYLFD
jgi:hypothetical protein